VLAPDTLRFTGDWSIRLGEQWRMEFPLKLHKMHEYAPDGTPEWSSEFERWLSRRHDNDKRPDDHEERTPRDLRGPYQNSPQRTRTTAAFRKLRRQAPQEFLALYDLCVLNPVRPGADLRSAFAAVARRLNERAIRKGYPERYTVETISILAYSATHKLAERWL
jgi:hypothetical protein